MSFTTLALSILNVFVLRFGTGINNLSFLVFASALHSDRLKVATM